MKRWANQSWPCSDMPAWGTRTTSQTSNLWGRWSADWTTVLRSHYAVKGRVQEVPREERKKKKRDLVQCFYSAYMPSNNTSIIHWPCQYWGQKHSKLHWNTDSYLFGISAHQCGQICSHDSQNCQRLMMFKEGKQPSKQLFAFWDGQERKKFASWISAWKHWQGKRKVVSLLDTNILLVMGKKMSLLDELVFHVVYVKKSKVLCNSQRLVVLQLWVDVVHFPLSLVHQPFFLCLWQRCGFHPVRLLYLQKNYEQLKSRTPCLETRE